MDSKKIIIVDDDTAILDSLGLLLNFEGFEVKTFERGSEIFNWVEHQSVPDAILLDMWLSDEDGREICKQLKKIEGTKNIPVIMMSANRGLEKTAIDCGANAFIAKPFEIDKVVDAIHQFTV
jgi:DNA-binding response OmpR family regulator